MMANCFPLPGKDGILLLVYFSSAQVSHVTGSKGIFLADGVSKGFTYLQAYLCLDSLPFSFSPGALPSARFGFTFSDVHRELYLPAAPEADRVLPSSQPPSRPAPANSTYTPTNLISRNTVNHGGGGSSSVIPKVKMVGYEPSARGLSAILLPVRAGVNTSRIYLGTRQGGEALLSHPHGRQAGVWGWAGCPGSFWAPGSSQPGRHGAMPLLLLSLPHARLQRVGSGGDPAEPRRGPGAAA